MKQLFKRSAAFLLCLAMLMGLFAGVPGAVISKISAEEATDPATTESAPVLWVEDFENETMETLFSAGWRTWGDGMYDHEVVADPKDETNAVLGYIREDDTIRNAGSFHGLRSPKIPVTSGKTVRVSVDILSEKQGNVFVYSYDADGNQLTTKNFSTDNASYASWVAGEWTTIQHDITFADEKTAYMQVCTYPTATNYGTQLYFDNFAVREVTTLDGQSKTYAGGDSYFDDFDSYYSLYSATARGWTVAHSATIGTNLFMTAEEGRGNVLFFNNNQNVDEPSYWTTAFRSPAVDVSNMKRVTISADVKTDTGFQLYYIFVKADGTRATKGEIPYGGNNPFAYEYAFNSTITADSEWHTMTQFPYVPADAKWLIVMPTLASTSGVAYVDNIRVDDYDKLQVPNHYLSYDFEDGGYASREDMFSDGWSGNAAMQTYGITTVTDPDNADNSVLKFTVDSANVAYLYTPFIDVSGLEELTLSLRAKVSNMMFYWYFWTDAGKNPKGTSGDAGSVSLNLNGISPYKGYFASGDWAEYTVTKPVPKAAKYAYCMIQFVPASGLLDAEGNNTGVFYIDDIKIGTDCAPDESTAVVTEPTCATKGYTTTTCHACDKEYISNEVPATGHDLKVLSAVPAGCESTGKTEGALCNTCELIVTKQKVVAATGHTDTTPKDHKCDTCGVTVGDPHVAAEGTHICAYCGQPASECVDDDKDHECDVCGEACGDPHEHGENTHTCAYCNKVVDDCEKYWVAGTYVDPTFESDGYTPYTCSVCGAEKKEYSGGTQLIAVAQIGDKLYESLEEAVADGGTIVLLANITVEEQLATAADTVINLNGYTLTVIEKITVNAGHTLKVTGEGKLIVNAEIAVAGTLDVYDLDCSATAGLVPGQSGTLAIANGGSVKLMSVWAGHTAEQLRTYRATFFNGTVAGAKVTVGTKNYTMNANGNWIIDGAVATIARTNNGAAIVESYTTLNAALADAKAGETIVLLADLEQNPVVLPANVKLDLSGKTIKGNLVGTIVMNGGTWITPEDYKMAGPDADYYKTSDAVIVTDVNGNITIAAGTMELAHADWWTGEGQVLTIGADATFIIPAGKNLNVRSTVVIEGTLVVEGTVNLYETYSTITSANTIENVVTTVKNAKVLYEGGVYTVHVHVWGEATCTEPAKCECGDTKGEALGHDSKYVDNGDGTHDYVCDVCHTVEIDNQAHIYDDDKDTTCNVCPAERVVEDEVKNYATSLGGDIGFKLYFDLTEETLQDDEAYVLFKIDGVEVERQYIRDAGAPDADGEYAFVCGVAAAQMTKKVSVQIVYGDNTTSEAKEYTILEYAKKRLNNPDAPEEEKALIRAMLNYGAYAQEFFGYNTGDLANTDISGLADVTTVTAADITVGNTQQGTATGIVIDGYSVLLESETTFKFSFALASGANIADYTFSYVDADGKTVPMTPKLDADGCYCVYIEDIPAAYLDQMYTITVTNTNDSSSYSLTTCVLCYAKAVMTNSNNTAAKVNMAKALYLYNQAANAYFNK